MKFLKEYKFTIIFILVILAIIAGLTIMEMSKEKKSSTEIVPSEGTQTTNKNLISPTKYQDIEEKYPIVTITMADEKQIKLELYPNIAPTTVENFIYLANSGYYNGLTFHRIVKDFMIQGGDPSGDGTGGPGYSIVGEFENNGYKNELKHTKGVISMARSSNSYDSAGSQFFIMFDENSFLDGDYAAFGKVIEGMDIVEELEKTKVYKKEGAPETSTPYEPPVIKNISVETFGIQYDEPERIS